MTGNGKHTTIKNGDVWGILGDCFNDGFAHIGQCLGQWFLLRLTPSVRTPLIREILGMICPQKVGFHQFQATRNGIGLSLITAQAGFYGDMSWATLEALKSCGVNPKRVEQHVEPWGDFFTVLKQRGYVMGHWGHGIWTHPLVICEKYRCGQFCRPEVMAKSTEWAHGFHNSVRLPEANSAMEKEGKTVVFLGQPAEIILDAGSPVTSRKFLKKFWIVLFPLPDFPMVRAWGSRTDWCFQSKCTKRMDVDPNGCAPAR